MTALLTFLLSPTGRAVALVVAFVAWTAYQRDAAYDRGVADCTEQNSARVAEEIARQTKAAEAAVRAATARQASTEREMELLERTQNEILEELENAGDACAIPAGTLERLRNIR